MQPIGPTDHTSLHDGTQARGDVAAQKNIIEALARQMRQDGISVQLMETHISWIVLAADFAYKFKKALQLEFLDYSTLAARHFYCQEEVRLNRRLAPDIYLGITCITGPEDAPGMDGPGIPIEYAVKMRSFDQGALWDQRLRHAQVTRAEIEQLAHLLAEFHGGATRAPRHSPWGAGEAVTLRTGADLDAIAALLGSTNANLNALTAWQRTQEARLAPVFKLRKAQGWVRECHGDLHCGNIVTIRGQVAVFDCIEFNEDMRWIDVMQDFAFAWMDLQFHGHDKLAARLLNDYLQQSGDYAGLAVLAYYRFQRAMVRCKVTLLRADQLARDALSCEAADAQAQAASYLAFCARGMEPGTSALIITHGFSGSGKSTLCDTLVELLGALQIRSDLERKRMHGLAPGAGAAAAPGAGIYNCLASRVTYRRLARLVRQVSAAGLPVIVDAAFLQSAQRRQFQALASGLGLPFFILDVRASAATLRERVTARSRLGQDASDAGLAVLEQQLMHHEALRGEELSHAIAVETETALNQTQISILCRPIMQALGKT